MMSELASAVAVAEDVSPRWCDTCQTSAGFAADIFAMVPSGLQKLGVFIGCDRCNPDGLIICQYCGTPAAGGREFWQHIRDVHSQAGGPGRP